MKIRNQLFLVFLTLGISASVLISGLVYYQGKKIILGQLFANLEAISRAKKIRLNEIIEKNHETLNLIANTPFLIDEVNSLTGKKDHVALDSILRNYKKVIENYLRIYIADQDGIIISSSDSTDFGKNISKEESFLSTKHKGKYLHGFFYSHSKGLSLTAGPIILAGKKINKKAVLFAEVEAENLIDVINDYTGLGNTGETVIAKRYKNHTVFLTPTKFYPDAAMNLVLPDNSSYGMNLALEGNEGIFTDILDYRKEKVIAYARFINATQWGLITKIDSSEAYTGIYILRNFLLLFNIAFVFIAFITSYLIGRYLAKPVEGLIESTHKIKEGDLTSRVRSYPKNELGILAESFNGMADNLEEKINELNKVAFVISHDLRAPLNNIIPLINYVKEDNKGKLTIESEQMLGMIESKATQMNELITEILETAKTQKKIKETIDTRELLPKIINSLNPPSHIKIDVQPDLPFILYPKASLTQVFQNLIENAVKYMDKKSGKISIEYSDDKEKYKFCIRDNGPGIKKEDSERIFEMFESTNTNAEIPSTGIGLGVVKKIVKDNGGDIWVESELGKGSAFYFIIPKNK